MMPKSYTYMIVENVPAVCEGIEQRMQLHPSWTHAGSFATIHSAIQQIMAKKPDLLFMDWGLSGGSAFEILQNIQNIPDYDPYVIFNTGFQADNPEIPEKLINEYKVDKYLVKPIWENLRLHLAQYLKEAALKVEGKRQRKEVWLQDISGAKHKLDLDLLICICQHPSLPRCRNFFFMNRSSAITVQQPWNECYELLNQSKIDYFITKHRNHLVVRSYVNRFERPYVWMDGLTAFKLDVTKESLANFVLWLQHADQS